MNPLHEMQAYHRQAFGVPADPLDAVLTGLLTDTPAAVLECAVRHSPEGQEAGRYRVGYLDREVATGADGLPEFLAQVEAVGGGRLDRSLLDGILACVGGRWHTAAALGFGLCRTARRERCKVKCYFLFWDAPAAVAKTLAAAHQAVCLTAGEIPTQNLLCGVNLYFDGRTDVEVYLHYDPRPASTFHSPRTGNLSPRARDLAAHCSDVQLSFDAGGEAVLHFHPRHPLRFAQTIGSRPLAGILSRMLAFEHLAQRRKYAAHLAYTVSLRPGEVEAMAFENAGLSYYLMLAAPVGGRR